MDNTLAGGGFTVGIPVNQRRRTSDMKMLVYKAIHVGRMSHLCRKVIDLVRPRGPAFVFEEIGMRRNRSETKRRKSQMKIGVI